jgi:hypothetical protein
MSESFDFSMDHRDKIAWMIETDGWALEPVPPRADLDPPVPAYAYTIGLEDTFSYPEVCVFGLTPVATKGLVGLLVDFLRDGVEPPIGAVFTGLLDNGLRSAILAVDAESCGDLFATATAWYGAAPYRMAQLAWPDRNGWLPWESGFEHGLLLAQPVLGEAPA